MRHNVPENRVPNFIYCGNLKSQCKKESLDTCETAESVKMLYPVMGQVGRASGSLGSQCEVS
jgi:hypothetical protein